MKQLTWNGNNEAQRQADEAYLRLKGRKRKRRSKNRVTPKVAHAKPISHDASGYAVYLKSAWWQSRRKQAIKAAAGKCQKCGTTRRLQVHHLTYVRLWREKAADLEVLCKDCHADLHLAAVFGVDASAFDELASQRDRLG